MPLCNRKIAWWAEIVAELDVEIWYSPGWMNANTDALSRLSTERSEDDLLEDVQVAGIACEPNEGDSEEWSNIILLII